MRGERGPSGDREAVAADGDIRRLGSGERDELGPGDWSSLLGLAEAQDGAQRPAQQPHCASHDPKGLYGSGAIRNEVRRSEAGQNSEEGDGAKHEERISDGGETP